MTKMRLLAQLADEKGSGRIVSVWADNMIRIFIMLTGTGDHCHHLILELYAQARKDLSHAVQQRVPD